MIGTGNAGGRFGSALAVCALFATVLLMSSDASASVIVKSRIQPLGMHECTYGPSFWCQNITNAAGCKAVKHCIQTTWETQKYPVDNDDICTICKNMVKEARDTLTSNATLEELQQVFYGSCQLLPLKVIKTECKKLADDFIPELVDTLASEMDPNVVCTVSGLCNNAKIDKLLLEQKQKQSNVNDEQHECEKCAIVMDKGENLVQSMSKDEMLSKIIMMCGELSSYSDACKTIVLTYNNEIYSALKNGFTKRNVCMLSGMCSEAFHPHADGYEKAKNALIGVEISNAGERGRIQIQKPNEVNDELTCEFCETLVKHLKDILVANTTEEQFLEVLKGICKQTGAFSDECSAMVEENYLRFYQFLTSELKGKVLCSIVGICPKSSNVYQDLSFNVPSYPLLPIDLIQTQEEKQFKEDTSFIVKNEQSNQKPTLVIVDEQPPKIQDIKPMQKSPVLNLYYEETRFVVGDVDIPTDKTTCFLCQSILNYVQQAVTDPKSEEEIRKELEKSCSVVPSQFKQQCIQFVDQYGDAFISLVAQEVDPSIICPELHLCPATDVSLPMIKNKDSNTCEFCVIIMSAIETEVSNKDNEKQIIKKLEKLCTKLPLKWKSKCNDIVSNQIESIIDMIVAQVQPKEMCVLLDACPPTSISESVGGDIETNMIASSEKVSVIFPGYDMGKLLANNYKMLEEPKVPTPFCIVCTVVMKYLNNEIKDKSNQEEIQQALDTMCSVLPNVEENECQTFVNTYYPEIIKFIQVGTDPGIACMSLMVCGEQTPILIKMKDGYINKRDNRREEIDGLLTQEPELDNSEECMACEAFVRVFDDRLNNNSLNVDEIDLNELCLEVDVQYKEKCLEMIDSYAQSFKNLKNQTPSWTMCESLWLCNKNMSRGVRQFRNSKCLHNPNYWCASPMNAQECKANIILDALKNGCETRSNNNDWLIKGLVQTVWSSHCTGHCLKFHPKCTICKDVIKDIKKKIKLSPIEQDITYRLETICDPLPNKDKCVAFIERNTEKFLNFILDDVSEESICKEIGYC